MSSIQSNKTNRVLYFDVLRVIACLSIIMIHTSVEFVNKDIGSLNFWTGNILDSLARIGVPVFIMISGALMLDKNYQFTTKKLIGHITKMVVFFVCWSAFYCVVFKILLGHFVKHESLSAVGILDSFIKGHYHLWFVYLIIGLYLIVPLLRLWVKTENKKAIEYFIILSIVFTYLIPQIISIGSNYSGLFESLNDILVKKLQLDYVGGFTTYFILGWYLNNYDIKKKKLIYSLGFLGLIISIVGTYILLTTTGKKIYMYDNLSINVLFQSLAVFVFVKGKFKNKNTNIKIINSISKYSLGIYAIHAMFVSIMYEAIEKTNFNIAIVNILIVFCVSFVLAYLGSFILSKIPFFKKIV